MEIADSDNPFKLREEPVERKDELIDHPIGGGPEPAESKARASGEDDGAGAMQSDEGTEMARTNVTMMVKISLADTAMGTELHEHATQLVGTTVQAEHGRECGDGACAGEPADNGGG